jgi:membrane protein YdbS with pleckstrin-like domain
MSEKIESADKLARQLFPDITSRQIKYINRVAWFRYAFFTVTSSLFVVLFLFSLIYFSFIGKLAETEGILSLAGVFIAPLIPGLYLLRFRRGGFLVNEHSLYFKQGFFFGHVRQIPVSSIIKLERVKEKSMNLPGIGHFKLSLAEEELFCWT